MCHIGISCLPGSKSAPFGKSRRGGRVLTIVKLVALEGLFKKILGGFPGSMRREKRRGVYRMYRICTGLCTGSIG